MMQRNSNEKRLAALHNRKLAQSSQNELVRNALSDKTVNKITKFSDSDDDTQDNQKITDILHDVDEGDDVCFAVKPQFLGKKGEKLMTMQSKIGSDDRFQLDERFESDSDSKTDTDSEDDETKELNNERQTLYNTMDSVLGGLGITATKHNPTAENQHVVDQYVRFDPTDVNHEKFLVGHKSSQETISPAEERNLGRESDDKEDNEKADRHTDHAPVVDDSTFFEVKTDFNKAIADSSTDGFSFKFDFAIESSQTDTQEINLNQTQAQDCSIKELQLDSSDEEETMDLKSPLNRKESIEGSKDSYFFYSINPLFRKGPISQFKRTKTMEEIEKDWIAQRQQLTAEYKKRHKDAVRFQKKFVSKT